MTLAYDYKVKSTILASKADAIFATLYNNKGCSNLIIRSYDHENLSFSKLAILAKDDNAAKNSLVEAFQPEIEIYIKGLLKVRKYLDYDEIKFKLNQTILRAIKIYNSKLGDFIHLTRKMFKTSIKFYVKEKALSFMREKKYRGERIKDFSKVDYILTDKLTRYNDNYKKYIELKCDIDEYSKNKSNRDKLIMNLYNRGYTFKEIASLCNESISQVSYTIYGIIKDMRKILNVSN